MRLLIISILLAFSIAYSDTLPTLTITVNCSVRYCGKIGEDYARGMVDAAVMDGYAGSKVKIEISSPVEFDFKAMDEDIKKTLKGGRK